MPEDQGVNGDRWTDEASRLFRRMGWEKIADSNIDIEGQDGLKHGIDSIFVYEDGFRPDLMQAVFIEAKRYKTTSFSKNKIDEWINVIDKKLREISTSEVFYEQYPKLSGLNINLGILAIWFHDYEHFPVFRKKLYEYKMLVNVPQGKTGSAVNRLLLLDNDQILKLASTFDAINEWNENKKSEITDCSLRFYYPSSVLTGFPIQEIPVLNAEFMFSKFILAKSNEIIDGRVQTADIVFYYGPVNSLNYFYRLREALLHLDMISNQNNLYLFLYQDDDEFRKIKPEVEKELKLEGPPNIFIKTMNRHSNLPSWIKDQD